VAGDAVKGVAAPERFSFNQKFPVNREKILE
jgi:hypothetical protein